MSVEAPTGAISAPTLSAPSAGGISLEGPAMPGVGQVSFEALSSMPQMEASLPSSAEFSPKGLDGKINFSDFSIIAQNVSPQPVTPDLSIVSPEPALSPISPNVKAVPIELNTIWQRTAEPIVLSPLTESVIEDSAEDVVSKAAEIEVVENQVESIVNETIASHREEFVATEIVQAKKVQGLLREVGVNEVEAEQIITGILEEKGIETESVQAIEEEQTVGEIGEQGLMSEPAGAIEMTSKPRKNSLKSAKSPNQLSSQEVEIDEKAQEARKNTVGDIVDEASLEDMPSGETIASKMTEAPDQKSEILFQLKMDLEKDGSFEEVVSSVRGLGQEEPEVMKAKIETILEENAPVRITQSVSTRIAEDGEVKKVLRRAKDEVLSQEPA